MSFKINLNWINKIAEDRLWPALLLGISIVLLLSFLLIPGGIFSTPRLIVGDVVQKSIKAPLDLTVHDAATIKRTRKRLRSLYFPYTILTQMPLLR